MVWCSYWLHFHNCQLYWPMGEVVEKPSAGQWYWLSFINGVDNVSALIPLVPSLTSRGINAGKVLTKLFYIAVFRGWSNRLANVLRVFTLDNVLCKQCHCQSCVVFIKLTGGFDWIDHCECCTYCSHWLLYTVSVYVYILCVHCILSCTDRWRCTTLWPKTMYHFIVSCFRVLN